MIYDNDFLLALDRYPHKTKYVRLTALDYNDLPKEYIEGKVTGGTINIDGSSSLRRTCSLSIIALDTDQTITDVYWAYDNKFKVEIGLANEIDSRYDPIIWFPQGIFIITSFSKNISNNSPINISISGQDKMCRLNGTVSGNLPHDVNFAELDTEQPNGDIITTKVNLRTIITNAIREYGQERYENIIINDLDDFGYELWTYRGEDPLYFIREQNGNGTILNMSFDGNAILDGQALSQVAQYYSMNTLNPADNKNVTTLEYRPNVKANIVKVVYGETAGYYQTPLVYNGELIITAGSSVTSMLDKLVAMLGEYEYFYNTDGQFVFQKKKTYVQEIFSPINGEIIAPIAITSPYAYKFDDSLLISKSINPQVDSIKNDFAVWGSRSGINGSSLPIHVRYAVDTKPTSYKSINGTLYTINEWDWRELIYQMACDFYNANGEQGVSQDYVIQLQQNNPWCKNGKTGYEQYYSDLQGFWREIYNSDQNDENFDSNTHWTKKLHDDPNLLNFWFDFLEPGESELAAYSVAKIGPRSKVDNNNGVKSIYYKETPEALFVTPGTQYVGDMFTPIFIQEDMKDLFSISTQGLSAVQRVNTLIRDHMCCAEGISLTTIPIYYLDTNTRIEVNGVDYVLNKITYQLNHNGTMSLSANKIFESFM